MGKQDNERRMHTKRIPQAREAIGTGLPAFPGYGQPRDEEQSRLSKAVKALLDANEILKKAAVSFTQTEARGRYIR
jgi:hypothetical protein